MHGGPIFSVSAKLSHFEPILICCDALGVKETGEIE